MATGPYGIDAALWRMLPPEDQAAIAAEVTGTSTAIGGYASNPPSAAAPAPLPVATPASSAPPPNLSSGTTSRTNATGDYPVAQIVAVPTKAPVTPPNPGTGWTLASQEAQIGRLGVATAAAIADEDDVLVLPGPRLPRYTAVTPVVVPAASPTAAPTLPPRAPAVTSQPKQPEPPSTQDESGGDVLILPGPRLPLLNGISGVPAPKAWPPPAVPPQTSAAGPGLDAGDVSDDSSRSPALHAPGDAPGYGPMVPSGKPKSHIVRSGPAKGVVLTPEDLRLVKLLTHTRVNGVYGNVQIVNPLLAVEAAKKVHLAIPVALAILSMESSGGYNWWGGDDNIFKKGVDPSGKHWGRFVTEAAYDAYRHLRTATAKQGVGPTQLTTPLWQQEADRIGGAWKPLPNMIVGFQHMQDNVQKFPTLRDAFGKYNGSGPFDPYANGAIGYAEGWAAALKLKLHQ